MNMKQLLLCTVFAFAVGGCQNSSPTRSVSAGAQGTTPPMHAHQSFAPLDKRVPLPLLPHMAEHQKANMRDHLAAVQEILTALSTNDFPGIERAASRIGYTEQMGQMCEHMGAGAAGFTQMALNFHRTADTITASAKARDSAATMKAVSATLQTCVGCHATYRQQIVNEATWNRIAVGNGKTIHLQPDKP